MTDLTVFNGVRVINGVEMMSTKGIVAICEKIGEPKRHGDIIEDVRNMLKKLDDAKIRHDEFEEKDNRGYTSQFWLNKKLCDTLISGYSIPIRYAIIEEFDRIKNQKKLPSNFKEALLALVEAEEEKERLQLETQKALIHVTQLEGKIEEDKPKVEQWERFLDSKGLISVGDAGKMFGIGRNKFFEMLREEKLIQKTSTTPYQRFVEQGIFVVVATSNESWSGSVTKVTSKGLDYISKALRIRLP